METVQMQFNFKIGDGNTASSTYTVNILSDDPPSVQSTFELKLVGSENHSFIFDRNTTIETGLNIIGFARDADFSGIEIYHNSSASKELLFTHNRASGVRSHLGHVYYRWEFGTPTQGFALGAIQDIQILSDLVNDSIASVAEANSLGEAIINILLGTNVDHDRNGTAVNPSDEYGFFTYSYGMRDHIKNAYTSTGATSELLDNGTQIFNNFAQYIGGGSKSSFEQGINTSSTIGAQIYNRSVKLIELTDTTGLSGILLDLQDLTQSFNTFIMESYQGFRSTAMDFSFTSDVTLDINTTQPNTSDTTPGTTSFEISVLYLLAVIIVWSKRRRKDNLP
jgi:hypothetical protein